MGEKGEIIMKLFIVGRVNNDEDWSFIGVFDDEEEAKRQCVTGDYFVGPCELNKPAYGADIDWPGAYYPKGK
jgi:hypothetical protein